MLTAESPRQRQAGRQAHHNFRQVATTGGQAVAVTPPTSEIKERKMTDLEVVLDTELPLVFTRRRSLTCIKATAQLLLLCCLVKNLRY
eukprot:m.243344 g.243344  ORF g.243344 m.243344 type:complete len:88 (+) comp26357_c0_seq5:492-755(+)